MRKVKGLAGLEILLQQLYDNGETYTLQIDSHTRFIENWDHELKKRAQKVG